MEEKKTYEVKLGCRNCGFKFTHQVKKGKRVEIYCHTSGRFGNEEAIACPRCETPHDVYKDF